MLQTRVVVVGRPSPNTDRLRSSKSDWAYAARLACSASASAFLDVRGVFAAEDVADLAGLAGVFGVGVEGALGRAWERTRTWGGITDGLLGTGRVFSTSDSVSVDNDENACTRLDAPFSPALGIPRRAIFCVWGRRSGFRELLGSSLEQSRNVRGSGAHKWQTHTGQGGHHQMRVAGWHGCWSDPDTAAGRQGASACANMRYLRLNCRLSLSRRGLRCWIASSP